MRAGARLAVAGAVAVALALATPAAALPATTTVTGRLVDGHAGGFYTYELQLPAGWRVRRIGREPPFGTHLVGPGVPPLSLAPVTPAATTAAAGARTLRRTLGAASIAALDRQRTAVRSAGGRIVAMVVMAAGPTPTAFALSLPPHLAGTRLRLASQAVSDIGRSLRLYLGPVDPAAVVSDPAGMRQAALTIAALAAAPSLVATIGPDATHTLARLEALPAEQVYEWADASSGQVYQLVEGGRSLLWDPSRGCFRDTPAAARLVGPARWAALLGTGSYAVRYQAPTTDASGITLRFGYIAPTRWPVQATALIDPATNLPRSISVTAPDQPPGVGSYVVTFDYATPVEPLPAAQPPCPAP